MRRLRQLMAVLVVLTLHLAQPYYPTPPLTIPQKLRKSCLHKGVRHQGQCGDNSIGRTADLLANPNGGHGILATRRERRRPRHNKQRLRGGDRKQRRDQKPKPKQRRGQKAKQRHKLRQKRNRLRIQPQEDKHAEPKKEHQRDQ
jgi:hypothetical protein